MSSCGPESEQILRSVQKQIRSQCFRKGEETNIPAAESIADLSVAKLRGDPTAVDDKLTSTGMIIGTAPYMSPEQWQSKPDIDGRADIYSLKTRIESELQPMLPLQKPSAGNFSATFSEE